MPMDPTIPPTANKFVIFPADKLTQAEAYKAWGDTQFRALSGEVNGILGLGRHVLPIGIGVEQITARTSRSI